MDRDAPDVPYEELMSAMPAELREALVVEPWRMSGLRALALPRRDIAITEFDWLLDLPLWQLGGRRFQVSPRAVLGNPETFPDHVRRIDRADTRFPVHVMQRRRRWTVLDGFHRIASAARRGDATISALVLTESDLARIC